MAEKATAAYHKVEDTVVGGYKKVENAFVDAFLEKVDEPESKDSEKTFGLLKIRGWGLPASQAPQ